jgi:hypothetical protein
MIRDATKGPWEGSAVNTRRPIVGGHVVDCTIGSVSGLLFWVNAAEFADYSTQVAAAPETASALNTTQAVGQPMMADLGLVVALVTNSQRAACPLRSRHIRVTGGDQSHRYR